VGWTTKGYSCRIRAILAVLTISLVAALILPSCGLQPEAVEDSLDTGQSDAASGSTNDDSKGNDINVAEPPTLIFSNTAGQDTGIAPGTEQLVGQSSLVLNMMVEVLMDSSEDYWAELIEVEPSEYLEDLKINTMPSNGTTGLQLRLEGITEGQTVTVTLLPGFPLGGDSQTEEAISYHIRRVPPVRTSYDLRADYAQRSAVSKVYGGGFWGEQVSSWYASSPFTIIVTFSGGVDREAIERRVREGFRSGELKGLNWKDDLTFELDVAADRWRDEYIISLRDQLDDRGVAIDGEDLRLQVLIPEVLMSWSAEGGATVLGESYLPREARTTPSAPVVDGRMLFRGSPIIEGDTLNDTLFLLDLAQFEKDPRIAGPNHVTGPCQLRSAHWLDHNQLLVVLAGNSLSVYGVKDGQWQGGFGALETSESAARELAVSRDGRIATAVYSENQDGTASLTLCIYDAQGSLLNEYPDIAALGWEPYRWPPVHLLWAQDDALVFIQSVPVKSDNYNRASIGERRLVRFNLETGQLEELLSGIEKAHLASNTSMVLADGEGNWSIYEAASVDSAKAVSQLPVVKAGDTVLQPVVATSAYIAFHGNGGSRQPLIVLDRAAGQLVDLGTVQLLGWDADKLYYSVSGN